MPSILSYPIVVTRVMTANMATFNEKILDDNLPSIFELIAEENMSQALRPAIKYVIKVMHCNARIIFEYH